MWQEIKLTHEDLYHARVEDLRSFFAVGMMRDIGDIIPDVDRSVGRVINIGAGRKKLYGTISLDHPGWDGEKGTLPYSGQTVDQIHAYHILEHLSDPRPCLRECQRVLKYGAHMNIVVPFWCSQTAFDDPDHKSFYTEQTFRNMFDDSNYDKDKHNWELEVVFKLIMGINSRNLALFVQLQRQRKNES